MAEITRTWDRVVDLAVLLEARYWPWIVGTFSIDATINADERESRVNQYGTRVLELIGSLDASEWRGIHEELRREAASLDDNGELYLLLRSAKWEIRECLTGYIAGALWIRHIAEVIRRGFEEAHSCEWPEEDQSFSLWFPRARSLSFGAERPLDDVLRAKPYMAHNFGLFTGSTVRWYLEGETEYFATLTVLGNPSRWGIELVNLRGAIASSRDNAALKLSDLIAEDKALGRFSMISFDADVLSNFKAIQRQVKQGKVVGHIAAHRPDFEFANFDITELVEVAARLDETYNFSGDSLRNADWTGALNGRAFAEQYRQLSLRRSAGLKGEQWGRALAAFALEHPFRPNSGKERPALRAVQNALYARVAHYDFARDHSEFNPDTLEAIHKPPKIEVPG